MIDFSDDPLYALRVLLVGKPGTGKSAKMLELARRFPRVVIFDSRGRFSHPLPEDKYIRLLLRGFDLLALGQLENFLRDRLLAPTLRCVVGTASELEESFEWVCRLVTGAEEICFWLANSQRPAHLHTDLRAAATHWIVFKTDLPHDLRAMQEAGVPVEETRVTSLPHRGFLFYQDTGAWKVDLSASNSPQGANTR